MSSHDWRERLFALAPPRPSDRALLHRGEKMFGMELAPVRRRRYLAALRAGARPEDALNRMAYSAARVHGVLARHGDASHDNRSFLDGVFLELLGREPEPDAQVHFAAELEDGRTREDIVRTVLNSEEGMRVSGARVAHAAFRVDLTLEHPASYTVDTGTMQHWFTAADTDDLAWLAQRIDESARRDSDAPWGLDVRREDRVRAQIVASFAPATCTELASAPTGLLTALDDLDITAGYVMPHARWREDDSECDVVCAFDVLENLTPTALADVLATLAQRVKRGGYAVATVSTYGVDRVHGERRSAFMPRDERDDGLCLTVPVDPLGYPLGGQITWATPHWWEAAFARVGMARIVDVERQVHARYGDWMRDEAPARQSLFVFGREPDPAAVAAVAARVDDVPARAGI